MASPALPAQLNGPPPSPANPPVGALIPPGPAPAGSPTPDDASPQKAIVTMGAEIDRALSALAQIGEVEEFAEARRLIQSGLAKLLTQAAPGGDMAASPTAAGASFPGTTPSSPVPRP